MSDAARIGDRVRFWIEDPAGYDEFTYEGTVVGVEDASEPPLLRVRWSGREYVRLADDLEQIRGLQVGVAPARNEGAE